MAPPRVFYKNDDDFFDDDDDDDPLASLLFTAGLVLSSPRYYRTSGHLQDSLTPQLHGLALLEHNGHSCEGVWRRRRRRGRGLIIIIITYIIYII